MNEQQLLQEIIANQQTQIAIQKQALKIQQEGFEFHKETFAMQKKIHEEAKKNIEEASIVNNNSISMQKKSAKIITFGLPIFMICGLILIFIQYSYFIY